MIQTVGWVLFGFGVWGLVILLHALQRRFAPDLDRSSNNKSSDWGLGLGLGDEDEENEKVSQLRAEIKELRQRVEVLEAIVTDKKYQFEQELNRPE